MRRLLGSLLLMLACAAPAQAQLPIGRLVVNLTDPDPGQTVSGTVNVRASVTIIGLLTVSRVDFYADGSFIGSDGSAPYSVSWDSRSVGNGSHSLRAVAQDILGVRWNSNTVGITVSNGPPPDTTAPNVSLTSPAGGATVSGNVTVRASASDNVGVASVQFRLDGANLGAADTSSPYQVTWNSTLTGNGTHTLTAIARDAAGNTRTSSPVTVTVSNGPPPDTTPPSVSITAPANGATVSGTITVAASASDNVGVASVQFRLDGANAGPPDTSAPYSIPWDTTSSSNGAHTITAVARDAAGNTRTSAAVTVTVANGAPGDTTPPSVSITAPANGATVSGTITVAASASDNVGVAGVQFRLDGANAGPVLTAPPYQLPWDTTTASDGAHTLTAIAADAAGNTRTSATVTVTVANGGAGGGTTRFEANHSSVVGAPAGAWASVGAEVAAFSGGTAAAASSAGATATFTFSGTAVSWLGLECNVCGIATVRIDGGPAQTVDTAGPAAPGSPGLASESVFSASGLAAGSHTLVITVTGESSSGGAYVIVDAFDVVGGTGSASAQTRIDDGDPIIDYRPSGAWVHGTDSRASAGTYSESVAAGATATFAFTGTEVRWVGLRYEGGGIARVTIDGNAAGEVDTYSASPVIGTVFTATGLANGVHTLRIEVTGTRNPAANNDWVVIDAFDVTR